MDDENIELTIKLTEVLKNQYIIQINPDTEMQITKYRGNDELEAYRVFKSLPNAHKHLYLADVQMMVWNEYECKPFIHSVDIIKRLA